MGSQAPAELTRTVVRGVGVSAVGYGIAQALTFAFYVALAHLANPRDFGQLAAGSILVGVGMLFVESGMLAALIHRRDLHSHAQDRKSTRLNSSHTVISYAVF